MTTENYAAGGCQCGSIRYRINAHPRVLYTCHCTDCQKQSSSAFGMSLIVRHADLEFVAGGGTVKFWDTHGEDGRLKRCAFCPQCGSRLYHSDEAGERISVKAGSLDDTRGLQPVAHIWLRSAQSWLNFERDKIHCFEKEFDDEEALAQEWQQSTSTP